MYFDAVLTLCLTAASTERRSLWLVNKSMKGEGEGDSQRAGARPIKGASGTWPELIAVFWFFAFFEPPGRKNAPGGPKKAPQTLNRGPQTLGEIWRKMQKTKKLVFCGPRKPGHEINLRFPATKTGRNI